MNDHRNYILTPGLTSGLKLGLAKSMSILGACIICLAGLVSPPGYAEGILEEVRVTATKRDTTAQDTGISLSALGEDRLAREGMDNFAQFATSVAGLAFGERGPGQSIIALRGINSSSHQFNTDEPESKGTVGVYLDETPVSLNGFNPDLRTFDLNRIEVLRGPQGTLFGAGSMAGTIRYISNPPDPTAPASKLSLNYSDTEGGDNGQEYNGMLNLPITDTSAFRFTGFVRDIGGFVDNVAPATDPRDPGHPGSTKEDVNTDDTYGGRLQLLVQPRDDFSATARLYYQHTETGGYPTEDAYDATGGNNPSDADLGEYQQSRLFDEDSEDDFILYNLELRLDVGFAELVSVTSYLERDLESNFESTDIIPFLDLPDTAAFGGIFDYETDSRQILNNITETKDIVQEFRWVSTSEGPFDWLVGVFYNRQDKRFAQDAPNPGLNAAFGADVGDNVFISNQTFKDEQYALFGEVSWNVDNAWRLIGGARWYKFEQEMFFDSIGGLFTSGLDITRNLQENGINPKVSLEFRPESSDDLWYITVARGFRLGGTNDPLPPICGVPDNPSFESDSLWNYELGYKTGDDRFQFNGALYYIDWQDAPVADSIAGCGFALTFDEGEITSIGLEADLKIALTEHLELSTNASYTNAEFTERFTNPDASFIIEDGTETPLVPDWTFNTSATYYFPLGGLDGYVNGTYSYQGDRYNRANVLNRAKMDGYGLVNFRVGFEDERWRAALYVNNLTDEHEVVFKDNLFLSHNRDSVTRPRTIGLTISVDI